MATRLTLLGSFAMHADDGEVPLPVDRRGCLLAYLAVEAGWVSRDRLALLFWPDADEPTAKRNLRQLLLRTRRVEPEPGLEVTPEAVRWAVATDVSEFRHALAERDAKATVAAYGGTLLGEFVVHDVGGFDAWLEGERDRLRSAFQDAGLGLAREHLGSGSYDEAARLLEALHRSDPLAEDVLSAYVQALYLAGRRDAALHAYTGFVDQLGRELGLEPLPATQELAANVRAGEPIELPSQVSKRSLVSLAPSRLAGRDAARRALLGADTPVVLLHGEPGIGKSSLLAETLPSALRARAYEGLERLPYHPLVELVRTQPQHADGLGPYLEDLVRLVPEIAPDVVPSAMDADAARGRVVEAIARFLVAGGGLVVVDDLQWADQATLETIVYLAGRGLRVYGAYRTAEAGPELLKTLAALRGTGRLTEVPVAPIDENAVATLMADLMGRTTGPPAFSRRLWEQTGGNPMYILETLRSLFESGHLRRDDEGWHTDVDKVTIDYSELAVPDAVQDVIVRRLEHLGGEATRLLEALAVTMAPLDAGTLASISGLSPHGVAAALDEAQTSAFVSGTRFRHDLLRQVIAARVPPARKRLLHGLIAAAVEGEADPALVAEHWLAAEEYAKALAAWSEKVARLRTRGLQPAAIEMLDSALARLPEGFDSTELRLELALVHRDSGDLEACRDHLTALAALDDLDIRMRVSVELAQAWLDYYVGSLRSAEEKLASVLRLTTGAEAMAPLEADIVMLQVSLANETGRHDEAIELLTPLLAALRTEPPSTTLINALTSQATLLDMLGENEAALELHEEALDLAVKMSSPYLQMSCATNLVYCLIELGRLDEGVAVAEAALELGDYDNSFVLRNNLAATLVEAGRFEEALAHSTMLEGLESVPHLQLLGLGRSAECLFKLGRIDEGRARLQVALDSLPGVEYAPSIGNIAIVTISNGTNEQAAQLAAITEGFDPLALVPFQRERLRGAVEARGAEGDDAPGGWWSTLVAKGAE